MRAGLRSLRYAHDCAQCATLRAHRMFAQMRAHSPLRMRLRDLTRVRLRPPTRARARPRALHNKIAPKGQS